MATIKKTAFLWTLAAISLGFTACGSDDKSDDNSGAKAECDFTAPRCNADGTKLETCTDGKLTVKECSCKDGKCEETADKECDFTAPRCNADGTKLETCTDGKLTVTECNCKDGKCEVTADKECDFTAPRCNADGTKLETCTDGKLTVRECSCKNGKCEGCNYEGTICDDKKQNVMSCDKDTGTEKPVEQCLYGCEDGKCLAEKCPSPDAKACVDMKTRRYCDTATGTMVEKKCEGDLICSDGDCQERDAEVSCDFEKRCTEDGRGIQDCVDGKIEYTQCKSGETCTTEGGIQCVKIETCENFKPYCGKNDDGSEYAVVCPVDAKPTDKPFVKKCGAVCRNGECVGKLEFGSPCDPGENGSWRDTCIGNKIARCIKRSDGGYEITEPKDERCEEKGMICGMERTDLEEFQDPHCYDPCTTIGQVVGSCVPNGAGTASLQMKCVYVDHKLGDNRMGYVDVPGSLTDCDIDCKEGKCVDYTEGIEDVGKACEKGSYKSRCHDARRAVTCDYPNAYDDQAVVQVEYCDYNETCLILDGRATCRDICQKGDPDKFECSEFLNNYASMKYTCSITPNGEYTYQLAQEDYMDICDDVKGCDKKTGLCVK